MAASEGGSPTGLRHDPWYSQVPGVGGQSSVFIAHKGWSYTPMSRRSPYLSIPTCGFACPCPSQGRSCDTPLLGLDTALDFAVMADGDSILGCPKCPKSPLCSCSKHTVSTPLGMVLALHSGPTARVLDWAPLATPSHLPPPVRGCPRWGHEPSRLGPYSS